MTLVQHQLNAQLTPARRARPGLGGAQNVGSIAGGDAPAKSAGGHVGAGVYTYVQGHRTQATISSSGGPLPPDFTGQTAAGVQQQMDALFGKGVFSVSSVVQSDTNTLVVEMDYCGATKSIGAPVAVTIGSVVVQTVYKDAGVSPAGACVLGADLGGGLSTGSKVAIGAGASLLTVAAVYTLAGWSITKGLDHLWNKLRGKPRRR